MAEFINDLAHLRDQRQIHDFVMKLIHRYLNIKVQFLLPTALAL